MLRVFHNSVTEKPDEPTEAAGPPGGTGANAPCPVAPTASARACGSWRRTPSPSQDGPAEVMSKNELQICETFFCFAF